MRIIVRSSVALFAETLCVMAARFERRGQSASWTLSRLPRALAYLPNVERRMSSAWFSMREIADFFVRSFLAIASWVIPAFSRAWRSIMLNSNASYPDSKFSANFGLRFLRSRMYRSTSLMTFSSNIQFFAVRPALFPGPGSFVAFSKIHSPVSTALEHQRIPRIDSYCHRFELEFHRDLLCRQAF